MCNLFQSADKPLSQPLTEALAETDALPQILLRGSNVRRQELAVILLIKRHQYLQDEISNSPSIIAYLRGSGREHRDSESLTALQLVHTNL